MKGSESDRTSENYGEATGNQKPTMYNHNHRSTAVSLGVKKIEILTAQYEGFWYRSLFYFSAFLCAYAYSLDATLRYQLQSYATSSYSQHSLYATVNVIRSVVAAASQPTYARLSDRFGRLELFAVSVIFYAVGTVIESQAYDINRYAGGTVLYQIGYSGVILLLEVSLADMSTLRWRLFASFVPATPFIINTWVSGDVMKSLYPKHSWNYAIGIWAFIFPLACVPLLGCFLHMRIKAARTQEWKDLIEEHRFQNPGSTTGERIKYRITHIGSALKTLFWELDVVGILFVICVFGFILVPFTIAGGELTKWSRGSTIAPLVVGFVLIPFFIVWELKFSRFPIMPFKLMRDRGVWSALIIALFVNFIWYMPNDFMYPVLIVGMRASIKAATRITSLYSFVSVITGPLLGFVVVRVRRTKAFIVFGCSMWFVAMGLLLHFRGSNNGTDSEKYINGVIGGLCVFGFGAGFFTYTTQLSIQTVTNHEYMAIVLSLYLATYNIGSAFGSAVSGAMWSQLMYKEMVKQMTRLGVDTSLAAVAYGSPYTFIIDNVWGTPARIAVALAYAHVQRKLCIVGLCLCVPLLVVSFFLRDHKLEAVQSLDETHNEGQHGEKKFNKGAVVVNDFDKDPIVDFFKRIFRRK